MFLWYLKYNKEKLSTDNLKLKKVSSRNTICSMHQAKLFDLKSKVESFKVFNEAITRRNSFTIPFIV